METVFERSVFLVRVHQTCLAAPSQWDAWTDTGQYLYLRFRHGYGRVECWDSPEIHAQQGLISDEEYRQHIIRTFKHGDSSVMGFEEFCCHAGLDVAPNCEMTSVKW